MKFKTLSEVEATRLAAIPLDYEWDTTIGNGFLAASEEDDPRLAEAIEALNIHGAADLVIGASEWCVARVQAHVATEDARLRLQSAWAATIDPRYSKLAGSPPKEIGPDDVWSLPDWWIRRGLMGLLSYLEKGRTAKVRQLALGTTLLAEHLCGRDEAFGLWLSTMIRMKTMSSPRRVDDLDHTSRDTSLALPDDLTEPSRDERVARLDPAANPYLRTAAEMAALGFIGERYL